jgi:hypothetical protein
MTALITGTVILLVSILLVIANGLAFVRQAKH